MQRVRIKKNLSLAISVVTAAIICFSEGRAEPDPFPVFACIQPNVSFWKKIYTQYPSDQGVIHDKRNLNIIYGVIELKNPELPGGRKTNRNRIERAKKKYKMILAKLMRSESTPGPEERQVAALFGPDAKSSDYQAAMRNIRCQVGQKDRFRRGIVRSGAYIDLIKRIFRESGLPEELAFLPHVESSFNTKAYSKFGAAGIWQFTRSTGRKYMRVGYAVDERRDPILSSYAAAKMLRSDYEKFKNWPMAITAYNHGATGMLRAQRKQGSYEKIFNHYRSRTFRFASRNFYSEFIAAVEAAKNYQLYFGNLKLDAPQKNTEVLLTGYASLADISRYLKLDIELLSRLNPALRKPVIHGQKYIPEGYRLRLPVESGQSWERLLAEFSEKIYKNKQKRSRIYTVRRGDTAGEIARMHGIKLSDLIAANDLGSRATIYVNQNLRIPVPEEKSVPLAGADRQIASARKQKKSAISSSRELRPLTGPTIDRMLAMDTTANSEMDQETMIPGSAPLENFEEKTQKQLPPALASLTSSPPEEDGETELFQNESFESKVREEKPLISARLESTFSGDFKPAAGQQPGSPEQKRAPETRFAIQAPEVHPEILQGNLSVEGVRTEGERPIGAIRVEVEETLGHYAEWLGVTARELRRLNGFSYGKFIRLNQRIKIPLHRVSKEEFEEKRFEFHKELSEDFFASYRVERIEVYHVKRGDNIWTLSWNTFEVPLWLIKRYNTHLDFNALVPSQKIVVPIVEKNV